MNNSSAACSNERNACSQRDLPVAALHQQNEIVAADVADEIQLGVAGPVQDAAGELDHLVALAVAVGVVEGLEVIEVAIAGDERRVRMQQALDMLVDRHIARQQGERVGVARRFQLHLRQLAQQVLAGGDADVAPVLGDDEAVGEMAAVRLGQEVAEFFDGHALFHQQRIALDQVAAGLLAYAIRAGTVWRNGR